MRDRFGREVFTAEEVKAIEWEVLCNGAQMLATILGFGLALLLGYAFGGWR